GTAAAPRRGVSAPSGWAVSRPRTAQRSRQAFRAAPDTGYPAGGTQSSVVLPGEGVVRARLSRSCRAGDPSGAGPFAAGARGGEAAPVREHSPAPGEVRRGNPAFERLAWAGGLDGLRALQHRRGTGAGRKARGGRPDSEPGRHDGDLARGAPRVEGPRQSRARIRIPANRSAAEGAGRAGARSPVRPVLQQG